MPNAVLDPAVNALMSQIRELTARVQQLERNQRSAYNAQNTSIEGDNLTVNDANGNPAMVLGLLPDGTYGVTGLGTAVPTQAPDTPIVLPSINGLMVVWDGQMGGSQPPMNLAMVQVHCSATAGFTPSSATLAGSIPSAGAYTVSGLTPGITYYVALVGANQQGNTGPASTLVAGVPLSVAQNITANQVTAQMLAANLIYAGIVNGTLISGAQFVADGTSGEFLCYDGPAGFGNLIGSWSGSGGTDGFGNPYPVGLDVALGSITGSVFSGLNFVLNQDGLFFYTSAAPITLVQAPGGTGNLNYIASSSPVTISLGAMNPTVKGNTVIMVMTSYTTGLWTTGAVSATMTQSHAAMTRIAHVPFQSVSGTGAVGWIDVWASYDTPGGDTGITWVMNTNTGSGAPLVYVRNFYEFSGLGTSPSIDVFTSAYNVVGTGTAFSSGSGVTTAPTELWLGGVAGYYNPSATMPTITGPAGPWINSTQIGGQIGGYTSSLNMMASYQILAATGTETYAGTFANAENWGAFALAIAPSVTPGGLGALALALSAVSGSDTNGNTFPVGYMGQTTAIQPGSSPVLPEGWHSIGTLPSGLTGSIRYKKVAEANCILYDLNVTWTATSATTWTLPALPSGYQPSTPGSGVRIYTAQGNSTPTAVGQIARLYMTSGGAAQFIAPASSGGGNASWTGILPLN
jgi:hypothetical protein